MDQRAKAKKKRTSSMILRSSTAVIACNNFNAWTMVASTSFISILHLILIVITKSSGEKPKKSEPSRIDRPLQPPT
jgi:hypothetical protein